jgi:hypothetical protein
MTSKLFAAAPAALFLALALAAPVPATAQGMSGTPGAAMPMRPDRTEGRIAFLKAELKVTEGQSVLWNAVADAMRANAAAARPMREHMHANHGKPTTAIERMEMQERMVALRADGLRRLTAAFRPFYAALSDEQKKTADELFAQPMQGRMGGRHGMGGPPQRT